MKNLEIKKKIVKIVDEKENDVQWTKNESLCKYLYKKKQLKK
jgi:hypothetical protein